MKTAILKIIVTLLSFFCFNINFAFSLDGVQANSAVKQLRSEIDGADTIVWLRKIGLESHATCVKWFKKCDRSQLEIASLKINKLYPNDFVYLAGSRMRTDGLLAPFSSMYTIEVNSSGVPFVLLQSQKIDLLKLVPNCK